MFSVAKFAGPYPFPPLTGHDTIRLFRLHHHEAEDAPLAGELFEYFLRDSGTLHLYEALSYTWGSEDTPESVVVDGRLFAITANLHKALVRLRNHTLDRVIWIDAICLNQRDDAEKQQQIPLMVDIYRKASRIIVDLGSAVATKDSKLATYDPSQALEYIRLAAEGKQSALDNAEERTGAIMSLLRRPYFQRSWVHNDTD